MVTNRKQDPASSMPAVDDGWWEALLADEGRRGSRAAPGHQPRSQVRADGKGLAPGRAEPNWDAVKELYLRDQIVLMRVTSCNRGGLLVENEDLCGFVPFSHLVDIAAQADQSDRSRLMESYVGRAVRLKVIECVPEEGRIVFSERAAQAEPGRRTALFGSLRAGARASGTVTNITDFGVFVDLGGVEGLIHISELSWGRVAHPSQIVRMGQHVEVQVLDLSAERCRVALSLKRLLANPWVDIGSQAPAGAAVPAVITSILSYGAFARLEQGVEGLIHASEMPLAGGQSVKDLLHEGQAVRVRVMHVDAAHQRMGLTMKIDAA
jgi:small subunit ribosomal protein S1